MSNPDQSPASPELDEYARACAFAREKASVAYVQRKMGTIGFMRAIEYMERMISDGVISTYAGRNLERMVATEAAAMAAKVPDPDGEAFRTAARLGLTLRMHGGCAQSSMPGSPSAYEVVMGQDPAAAMREAVARAEAVIANGGESQRLQAPVAGQPAESSPAEDEVRELFEIWYEADAMPLEANWFKRDEDGDYLLSPVWDAWKGFRAAFALDGPLYFYRKGGHTEESPIRAVIPVRAAPKGDSNG